MKCVDEKTATTKNSDDGGCGGISHRDGQDNKGGLEVVDIANAFDLGRYEFNVLKYLLRAQFKGKQIKDLKKARWYLDYRLAQLEKGGNVTALPREAAEQCKHCEHGKALDDSCPDCEVTTHTLVVLDLETGGLDPNRHGIVEIAAAIVEIENTMDSDRGLVFRYGETWESQCIPDLAVETNAALINGYTAEKWEGAPSTGMALRAFFSWMTRSVPNGAMWCGSNPSFDLGFLRAAEARCVERMPTYMSHRMCNLASLCFPLMLSGQTEGIGLRHLRKWAGLEGEQKHRAMADVLDTIVVLKKYLCACQALPLRGKDQKICEKVESLCSQKMGLEELAETLCEWLTNERLYLDDETIEAMWEIVRLALGEEGVTEEQSNGD
jgi:DNA polymerase III epsilon subunit-like protein